MSRPCATTPVTCEELGDLRAFLTELYAISLTFASKPLH